MNPRASGAGYELLARRHLEHAGLTFCAANVAVRGGELDLKQQRLLHAAAVWLAGRGASFDTSSCRFDVLAITGSQLEWIPNAFNAD